MLKMQPLITRVTKLLGCKTPIIVPPMAGVSGGLMAGRVSKAGGFGFIATGLIDGERFKREISLAKSILADGGDSTSNGSQLPIGVGFIGWTLDFVDDPSNPSRQALDLTLDLGVRAVWFSFGTSLGRWINYVRAYEKEHQRSRTLIMVLVNSVQEALTATKEWGADILVAQGIEAGGHGLATAPPILSLVPSILAELPDGPPILAAGGLSTGSHLAAMIALGAQGAVYGTRFLLTEESMYSTAQKESVQEAGFNSTVRTLAFDEVRGSHGWPDGIDGRALRNKIVDEATEYQLEERRRRYQEGARLHDKEHLIVWAGTGVGLVNELKPAADLVREIHEEAMVHIKALQPHII